ncbi:hypothetical protein JCM11251_007976 [Rhodosporidiobolus azoricus]
MSAVKTHEEVTDHVLQAALSDPAISTQTHLSSRVFALLSVLLTSPTGVAEKRKLVRQIRTFFLFKVENETGVKARWWVDMKKKGSVRLLPLVSEPKRDSKRTAPRKPDVVIKVADKDLVGLAMGRLSPQKLYAAKRLYVHGDPDRALLALRMLDTERAKLEALSSSSASTSPSISSKRKREIWGQHKSVAEMEKSAPGAGGAVKAKL